MGYEHHTIYVGIIHGHDVLDFEIREGCWSSKSKAGLAERISSSMLNLPTVTRAYIVDKDIYGTSLLGRRNGFIDGFKVADISHSICRFTSWVRVGQLFC
jgi:hypothetical protein